MTPAQKSLVARLENKVLPRWTGVAQEAADMIKGLCAQLDDVTVERNGLREELDDVTAELNQCEKKRAATLKTLTR